MAKSSVSLITFNVPPNSDVMKSIFDIANREQVNVIVISASGKIKNATLHSSTYNTPNYILYGPFTLLSLTGSYLYNNENTLNPGATPPFPLSFGINLSTSEGKLFCGVVGGKVIAGENVQITLSTYKNPNKTAEDQEEGDNQNDNN